MLKLNRQANLSYFSGNGNQERLDIGLVKEAVDDCHEVIDTILTDIPVDIFEILGMRNLSAFVGELFGKSLERVCRGRYRSNPHQDGYPDLLLMDETGEREWAALEAANRLKEKGPFSPFGNGGLEIKATCGAVPTPKECARRNVTKPDMGETRIDLLRGYDWKAHHRETNNLLGLLWDFDDQGAPRVMAVFFGNDLTEDDWGAIVQPREGGGRTTSVSIMPRSGVRKMYENWLVVEDDPRYINFLNAYNRGNLM